MPEITIPHNYTPRHYQMPFFNAMDNGALRALLCWHRRSGKTKSLLNFAAKSCFTRKGVYYHCFPEYGQGRKIVWDGIDKDGMKYIDHFPPELRLRTNASEMKIELKNGSIYQVIGADNYDSLVGTNAVGLILDEWAVSDKYPDAWDYFRPILAENGGWAVFPFTPRGRNHGFNLYQMALNNPDWFCQVLTSDDTEVIKKEDIQKERDAGMSEAMIEQEFYCSFLASTEDIVIPYELINKAIHRETSFSGAARIAGCDPARYGDDRTGLVIRQGGSVVYVASWKNFSTVKTFGKLKSLYDAKMFDKVAIDVIGFGAGIYDMVNTAGIPCVQVNVAEASSDKDRFPRLRDELWWAARRFFEGLSCSVSHGIPKPVKDQFIADIQDIHYEYDLSGRIKVESKDKMKERLGFSPDLGDALCCTLMPGIDIVGTNKSNRVFKGFSNFDHRVRDQIDGEYTEVYVS